MCRGKRFKAVHTAPDLILAQVQFWTGLRFGIEIENFIKKYLYISIPVSFKNLLLPGVRRGL